MCVLVTNTRIVLKLKKKNTTVKILLDVGTDTLLTQSIYTYCLLIKLNLDTNQDVHALGLPVAVSLQWAVTLGYARHRLGRASWQPSSLTRRIVGASTAPKSRSAPGNATWTTVEPQARSRFIHVSSPTHIVTAAR